MESPLQKPGSTAGFPDEGAVGVALPPEAPLRMPRHAVAEPRTPLRARRGSVAARLRLHLARLVLLAGTLALTTYGVREMYGVLSAGGVTPLQWAFLALFGVNFLWIAFAGTQVVLGFLHLAAPRLRRGAMALPEPLMTAVLVPIYNEDADRLAAAVQVMADDLARLAPGRFAFFVLSDTRDPDHWVREEAALRPLTEAANAACPVYYRHRRDNADRKAGNIAEWVQRWGGKWDAMLLLDADSLMGGETMVSLSRRLAADPGLGLIQTVPAIFRARTLYARLQQFASRCYGPVFGHGLAVWYGLGGNYWGHNAIVRTRAFAESAGLPRLPGQPPFGGSVLSHDFVEAAMLRRGGWGVRLDADLEASHEEAPPSLVDVMVRDRRWCQGNFQHARFLPARGFAGTSRLHFLAGIMSYASAACWFALVIVGLLLGVQAALTRPEYFAEPGLFPTWPVFDSERAIRLFVLSMSVVLAPKLLGWLRAAFSPWRTLGFGGPLLATASVAVEIAVSALYAPIMMVAQTEIVRQVLAGKDSGWHPQRREDGGLGFGAALRAHVWHAVTGGLLAAVAWWIHAHLFLWLLPVTAGLVLAPVLSWMSGKQSVGDAVAAIGLLRVPGEVRGTELTDRLEAALAERPAPVDESALTRIGGDADLRDWHLAHLESPGVDPPFDGEAVLAAAKLARAPSVSALEAVLTPGEAVALLHDPALVRRVAELPRVG